MSDQPDNLILVYLLCMDAKLDRLADDVHDLKVRVTALEEGLAGVNRRLDRIEARLHHVEKHLDLVQSP